MNRVMARKVVCSDWLTVSPDEKSIGVLARNAMGEVAIGLLLAAELELVLPAAGGGFVAAAVWFALDALAAGSGLAAVAGPGFADEPSTCGCAPAGAGASARIETSTASRTAASEPKKRITGAPHTQPVWSRDHAANP